MSHTVRDVRCTTNPEHYDVGVWFKVADGPPPCAECGSATQTFYATREMEAAKRYQSMGGIHYFKEFEVDDGVKITSPEGLERYKQQRAAKLGVSPEQVVLNSRGNVKERVEELRHRAITTRRENGFDEHSWRDYKAERNRLNAEEAARRAGR